MTVTTDELIDKASGAKAAAVKLGLAPTDVKNAALRAIAKAIRAREGEILAANAHDCGRASARIEIDRLRLTPARVAGMARDVEAVATLDDPVGEQYDQIDQAQRARRVKTSCAARRRRCRLRVATQRHQRRVGDLHQDRQRRRPAGRQRSVGQQHGNRGGDSGRAARSRTTRGGRAVHHLDGSRARPAHAEAARVHRRHHSAGRRRIDSCDDRTRDHSGDRNRRGCVPHLCRSERRSGDGGPHRLQRQSPASDDLQRARLAAGASRYRTDVAAENGGGMEQGRGRDSRRFRGTRILAGSGAPATAATSEDWGKEFLSLVAAVKVVGSLDEALDHIREHGSGHSEAIVTSDTTSADRFLREVDAAAVFVNASTQFTDGGEFGLGTEVGISTQKLHARGPMGLRELTTYKWIVEGTGQIRN